MAVLVSKQEFYSKLECLIKALQPCFSDLIDNTRFDCNEIRYDFNDEMFPSDRIRLDRFATFLIQYDESLRNLLDFMYYKKSKIK